MGCQVKDITSCSGLHSYLMSYHADFWVAIAAAAPVIALANTVSITDAVNTWLDADVRNMGDKSQILYFSILFLSALNFALQIAALYWALYSFREEKDQNIHLATEFVLIGLVEVLALIVYGAILKYIAAKSKSKEPSHKKV